MKFTEQVYDSIVKAYAKVINRIATIVTERSGAD